MERRRSPRTEIDLECTLMRNTGSPITARTIDLGPGGMCVRSERPLAEDELIEFSIPQQRFDGRARVVRERHYKVYSLRFEDLAETHREALLALADGPPSG